MLYSYFGHYLVDWNEYRINNTHLHQHTYTFHIILGIGKQDLGDTAAAVHICISRQCHRVFRSTLMRIPHHFWSICVFPCICYARRIHLSICCGKFVSDVLHIYVEYICRQIQSIMRHRHHRKRHGKMSRCSIRITTPSISNVFLKQTEIDTCGVRGTIERKNFNLQRHKISDVLRKLYLVSPKKTSIFYALYVVFSLTPRNMYYMY